MKRGEELRALEDYDLFDNNVKDKIGVYLKTDSATGKHLVYFEQFGEWAELKPDAVERVNPGKVTAKNKRFILRVQEMKITY